MMDKKQYLYCGLLTVVIEWLGLLISVAYIHPLNPDRALSTATVSPWPLPLIFGVTLTLAGLTYWLFSLALKPYSKLIPYYALIAGIAFMLTGWVPYSGNGGVVDIVHQICSYSALFGYIAVIWLLRSHPKRHIRVGSNTVVGLIGAAILVAGVSHYIFGQYFAYVQLMILILIQSWTVLVIWHERKSSPLDIRS